MNKKIKFFAFMTAFVACVASTFSIALNHEELIKAPATLEYELVFDKTTKPNKNNLPAIPENLETPENINQYINGAFGYMPVTTKLGYNDLKFFYEGGFHNPNGFITLGYNGTFGNSYLKNSVNHGRINGLTRLNITYAGSPLIVNYGYEAEMEHREYRVTSVPLVSGQDYLFDGNHPQYFSIMLEQMGVTQVEKIKLYYSCNQDEEKLPKEEFYTSGYQIGALKTGEEGILKGTASNAYEAHLLLDMAALQHYQEAHILFNFQNDESEYDFINFRRNFSHYMPYCYSKYKTGNNITNKFLLIYSGESTFNYDAKMFEGFDPNNFSLYNHKYVAQINSVTTKQNITKPLACGSAEVRKNYAKTNNLYRDPNYDEFPINNLKDTFDVYNSEELWWCAANNFRPNFKLKNSKAEWIYNEAKKILNTIIYDGMTDYEKARAIYEWIITENDYDRDAVSSCRPIEENICYFLEGVFERRRGVCDSFSKTFVLLGKIEGLDVMRGCGYTHPDPESNESPSGHAWAYFRYPGEQQYRLICPTWGSSLTTIGDDPQIFRYVDYTAFMASRTYFADHGKQFDFIDGNQDNKEFDDLLSKEPWTKSVYELDKIPTQDTYDYQIDTLQELTFVFNELYKASNGQNIELQVDLRIQTTRKELKECFNKLEFSNDYIVGMGEPAIGLFDFVFVKTGPSI